MRIKPQNKTLNNNIKQEKNKTKKKTIKIIDNMKYYIFIKKAERN